jgi:hypothetical protein
MTLDEDGTVSDLSGNGNDGTNNGCLPSEDGLVFNGVDTGVTASSINLGSGSFGIYTKVIFYSSGINQSIIAGDNLGPFTFRLDWLSTGRVSVNIFSQNSGSNSLGFNETYSFLLGEDYTIVMGFNFLTKTITIYINGEQLAGSTTEIGTFVSMANTATYGFGHIPRATTLYHLDGEILDIKLKTVLPTAQEAIDYHNSFILPTLVETFDEGADGIAKLPREWIAGTGTYKISQVNQSDTLPTFPGGIKLYDKYLECTVAGTSGTLSYQGTGTYSWDMFKGGDGNTTTFNFINSLVGAGNRYSIDINSDESVSLEKDGSNLFVTAASYTSINTWYHFDVTVTKAGIRTALMDGIEIVEATGSNPVTDTDYMTSIFTSIDFDAGDRVANFNYKDEIEQ